MVWTCFWPGLSRLWFRGDGRAFLLAAAFGIALQTAWWASCDGSEQVAPAARHVLVGAVAVWWVVSSWRSYRTLPQLVDDTPKAAQQDLFLQAQGEYLSGHWFEAETLLKDLLRQTPGDAEAHLLLATLYRRTRRSTEARTQLDELARLDAAVRWRLELFRERQALERLDAEATAASPSPVT